MRRLTLIAVALSLAAGSAAAGAYRAPRAADGHPDLQGDWTNASLTHLQRPTALKSLTLTDAEATAWEKGGGVQDRPDEVGQATSEWIDPHDRLARIDGKARSGWIVDPADGRLPYTPAGRQRLVDAQASALKDFDGPEARPASERCLIGPSGMAGPPMLNSVYEANYQIVQTAQTVVIVAELNHEARIIRIGDARHPPVDLRLWAGDSIGRWEGDTLVIETQGFHPLASWRGPAQLYLSPQAKVTERLTRTSAAEIRYLFTVEDPQVYSRPWTGEMVFRPGGRQIEFACHEGNYALPGILAGARRQEAAK
ncbi:hypothetical protein [Phenylobacterium sp.]|uniref:hypothetical protein n=1 Tax=Phenylobacterium sp. TaxID=1871053 RepID=UPI002DF6C3E2|nr:hypothetical protein [Phenylobacterium sp.]